MREKLTRRAWPVWIVLGVVACLIDSVIPSAGASSLLSAATGMVSVGFSLYGVRRYRSASVTAWLIFVGGQLSWVLGEVSDGLGLTAVAEGVETAEQAAELHRLGYRRAQGYYFGRPVAEPDFRTKSKIASGSA